MVKWQLPKSVDYSPQLGSDYDTGTKSLTHLYFIGLYTGYYLKRVIHDTRIMKALNSGQNVYFLARDMTPIWEYFKDQYPNAKIVYNINRKNKYKEKAIQQQIDLQRRGLVIDSGFTGTVVSPIVESSKSVYNKTNGNHQHIIKGLLLSGSVGSRFPYILDNTYRNKKEYGSGKRNGRAVIIDLEHSPKAEQSDSLGATWIELDKVREYRAFRLGFHAGLQGLNKRLISDHFRKAIAEEIRERRRKAVREKLRAEIYERRMKAKEINVQVKAGLKRVDDFANLPSFMKTFWTVCYPIFYDKTQYEIVMVAAHKDTPIGYHYGKHIWNTRKAAIRAAQATATLVNGKEPDILLMERKAKTIIEKLDRLDLFQERIEYLKEQVRKGKPVTVTTSLYI